jgi:hypothetical protein
MRIRTIKPEFFVHEELFAAEQETGLPLRIAYIGLWCAADREGRFKWEPRRLGVQILPYDALEFSRVLDALVTRGFLVKYACKTGVFGLIPSFKRHQVINNKERASELPDPASSIDPDACSTREPRDDDACHKEGKGREQGKEGNIHVRDEPATVEFSQTSPAALAAKIVSEYPKPGGNHSTAEHAVVLEIESGTDAAWLRACVNIHAARYKELPPEVRRYCPSRETYFVQKRWTDDPDGPTWKHYPETKGKPLSTMETGFVVVSQDLS